MKLFKKLLTVASAMAVGTVNLLMPEALSEKLVNTVSADTSVAGDANGDGNMNIRDAAFIARCLAQGERDDFNEYADYNGDGKTDIRDAAAIAKFLATMKPEYTVLWAILPQVKTSNYAFTLSSSLSDSEVERITEIANMYEKRVEELSNNSVDIKVDVVVSKMPVDTLTEYVDESYYVNCYDLPSDIMSISDNYDCVLSCASLMDDEYGFAVGQDYWGLADTDKTTYGWSYAFIQILNNDYYLYEGDGCAYPEEVWVHEWIHTLEGRMSSYCTVPSADGSNDYGYTADEKGSYYEYYHDILTGNVINPDNGKKIGMTADGWAHICY